MGNKVSIEVKHFCHILPKDIWFCILLNFDLKSLAKFAEVCKFTNLLANHEILWKIICQRSGNYGMMIERKKITQQSWKQICQLFLKETIIKTCEVIVGNNDHPDKRVLFQLRKDGKCFISDGTQSMRALINVPGESYYVKYNSFDYCMRPITDIKTELYAPLNNLGKVSKYIPFTDDSKKYKLIRGERNKLEKTKIIDIHHNFPHVLLLSDDNRIFEFMLSVSWFAHYDNYSIPTEIVLPIVSGDSIKCIKSTEVGNFVIVQSSDGKNKVFLWSYHSGVKIFPVLITSLSDFDIIDVNYIDHQYSEFVYLDGPATKKLTVENQQLFYLLLGEPKNEIISREALKKH
jgi:hypothetical protein